MPEMVNRRNFLQSLSLLPLCATSARAAKKPILKVSLNAYSFNKLLNHSIKARVQGVTLLEVLDFADTQMRNQTWETVAKGYTRDQVQDWIAAALKECADRGKQYGVRIGVQNHGDFLKTGEDLLKLVKAVGSSSCGPIVDTGYFRSNDPYREMALVAPHAVNWQIKQSIAGPEPDNEIPVDLVRLTAIIRKSGYSGYLPIETLGARGKDYDPYAVVPQFLKQLREALTQTA